VYNTCFVQMCKFGHVVCFIKFGRVDLVDAVGCYFALLH
jgi:hypothetical protein